MINAEMEKTFKTLKSDLTSAASLFGAADADQTFTQKSVSQKRFRRIFDLFATVGYIVLIQFCNENPLKSDPLQVNESISLKYGEIYIFKADRLEVGFHRLIQEGRCPLNVQCFWEGLAEIEVWLWNQGTAAHFIKLPIYGYVTRENTELHITVDTLGYQLTLMELNPYPEFPEQTSGKKYEAIIKIETK
jgi:hypothetical protein